MILYQANNSSALGLYGAYVEITKCDLVSVIIAICNTTATVKGKEQMVKSNINDGVMSAFLLCFHKANCHLCVLNKIIPEHSISPRGPH